MATNDDILAAAKALPGLQRPPVPLEARNGVPLLPVSQPTTRVTLELVHELRD